MNVAEELFNQAQRERVLVAGQPGSGKSYSLFALADYIQLRDPEAKIYVLDADRGMGKVSQEWPQVQNITEYRTIKDWEDVTRFVEEVGAVQTARDWVFIDMLGRFWEMAQSLEVEAVHGLSPGQAMLEQRRKMVEAAHLQAPGTLPQPDWTVIKRFHNAEFIDLISNSWDAHLVATTGLNKLDTERDDSLLVEVFAPFGFRPEGEKYNVHRFDTVMLLAVEGDFRMFSTAKDRGRPLLKKVEFKENLWDDYTAAVRKAGGYTFADSLQ